MVTRRSTHANHARPSTAPKRRANRRASSSGAPLYAGGKQTSLGGHISNVAGLGSGYTSGDSDNAHNVGNVAGLGSDSRIPSAGGGSRGAHRRSVTPRDASDDASFTLPNGNEVLITRRQLLYGALGAGVLVAGGAVAAATGQLSGSEEQDVAVLEVPESAVTTSEGLTQLDDYESRMHLDGSYELPYGSLVWVTDDELAACLLPTEGANPLTQVALLFLGSGDYATVLDGAVGLDEGFEIYDVRATSSGVVWTEADILDGVWRVYTATWNGSELESPALVEEGGADWETPSIAAVGDRAFWQLLPKRDGAMSAEDSLLKGATMGTADAKVLYASHGRMATPPYSADGAVVITPRADVSSIHYQLTRIDAKSGEATDTITLPASMKPLEAGYGKTGFSFSFDAIYDYGDGIKNLGTYTPAAPVADGDYSAAPWFCFDRTPTAPPAWCGSFFMVKSTSAVCGVDMERNEYFAFDVEDGADTYGEYLASSGSRDVAVTYANIDHTPLSGERITCCRVRVWSPAQES